MVTYRCECREDHTPPLEVPTKEKIGTIAGYEAFGGFIDGGGYETDQSVLDQIAALNEAYQDDEFDPRQTEATSIWNWLKAVHEIDDGTSTTACSYCSAVHTMSQFESARDTKLDRLTTLGAEIDDEWCAVCDTIRGMVSDDSYQAYLEDVGEI
jgi:hypothetical protein